MFERQIATVLGVKMYLIVGAACVAVGAAGGATVQGKLKDAKIAQLRATHAEEQAKAATDALVRTQAQGGVTAQVGQEAAEAQVRIEYRYRTLRQKVPVYVPKVTPPGVIRADDAVPVGALVLLDAAARGDDPDSLSVTAGKSYDLGSAVHFTQLVDGYVANLGIGHANSRQLTDLQDWTRRQAAVP